MPTTLVMVLALLGCGASDKEVRTAKTSGYKADFAVVYSEALAAVVERYPKLVDSARAGIIQTAWHPVNMRQSDSNMGGQPQRGNTTPGAQSGPFGRTGPARTFFFVRFRVTVVGGKPWRVRIKGEAAKWEEGATPSPLNGADMPAWLPGRVDGLRVKIHRRLEKYAVPMKLEVVGEDKPKKAVPAVSYGSIPAAAAKVVGRVREAAASRDYTELRGYMANDLVWSHGAAGSGDQALVMWQADGTLLTKLTAAIDAKCAGDAKRVTCPASGVEPAAVFELGDGGWKLSRFIGAD